MINLQNQSVSIPIKNRHENTVSNHQESEGDPNDMMDLSHGSFDNEINFAENMLKDMEHEVNIAIKKLKEGDGQGSSSPTAVY